MPTYRIRLHVAETKTGSEYYEVTAPNAEAAKELVASGEADSIDGEMYTKNYDTEVMECEEI